MISSQRDTLFVMADALEEEYPSFASEVRRAADTIWELRNKLAGTVDQSEEINKRTAELDFQIADNWRLTALSESLKEQNAKLRELCKMYAKVIEEDGCHWCSHYEDVACDPETVPMRGGCGCMLWEELRELGVTDD